MALYRGTAPVAGQRRLEPPLIPMRRAVIGLVSAGFEESTPLAVALARELAEAEEVDLANSSAVTAPTAGDLVEYAFHFVYGLPVVGYNEHDGFDGPGEEAAETSTNRVLCAITLNYSAALRLHQSLVLSGSLLGAESERELAGRLRVEFPPAHRGAVGKVSLDMTADVNCSARQGELLRYLSSLLLSDAAVWQVSCTSLIAAALFWLLAAAPAQLTCQTVCIATLSRPSMVR